MDYKNLIIGMIEKIDDDEKLKRIFRFIHNLLFC